MCVRILCKLPSTSACAICSAGNGVPGSVPAKVCESKCAYDSVETLKSSSNGCENVCVNVSKMSGASLAIEMARSGLVYEVKVSIEKHWMVWCPCQTLLSGTLILRDQDAIGEYCAADDSSLSLVLLVSSGPDEDGEVPLFKDRPQYSVYPWSQNLSVYRV